MGRLPPGPKWLRPIDFFQSGMNPPALVLKRLAARYGDPFRVSYLSGPVTFTGNPEALQAIYSAKPSAFSVWGREVIEPVFGKSFVVATSGDRHRQDRKLLSPVFNGNPMRAFGKTIAKAAEAKSSEWVPGHPFRMLETTQNITLEIMVKVVFGIQEEERVARTHEAVVELIDSMNPLIFAFPSLRREFNGFGPWARYKRAVKELDAKLSEEIRSRSGKQPTTNDILGLLMVAKYDDGQSIGEPELLDNLRGLLFAGHEATAIVLAWICYWIHCEPQILEKLLIELDALGSDPDPNEIASLPYLEAVCKETLRLCPPVVDPARFTLETFDMAGYTVPAGEAIRPSINLLHARPELYPEPERFRPERFLERKYTPFEFIPFGGGARRCLGAAFAMYEMKIVLGVILRNYKLHLANNKPVIPARRGIVIGPAGGVQMVCEGRRRA
jgi:cytochrome P450